VQEYLEFDRNSEFKNEFYRGRIFDMAGGSLNHAAISASVGVLLCIAVNGACTVFSSNVRLAIELDSHYVYPDAMVVCGQPAFANSHRDTPTNPILIVEVLSPTTELTDRGRKLADYRGIPTLREYMMISQAAPRVELYRRQPGGSWLYEDYRGLESAVPVASVNATLNLADLYRRIEFPSAENE
jgi:Uma2 family endonuclease